MRKIEPASHAGNKANRKLQTLAFVYRHNAHNILFLADQIDFPRLFRLLCNLLEIADKLVEAVIRRPLKLPRLLHIRRALDAVFHHGNGLVYSRAVINILHELGHGGIRDLAAELLQHI